MKKQSTKRTSKSKPATKAEVVKEAAAAAGMPVVDIKLAEKPATADIGAPAAPAVETSPEAKPAPKAKPARKASAQKAEPVKLTPAQLSIHLSGGKLDLAKIKEAEVPLTAAGVKSYAGLSQFIAAVITACELKPVKDDYKLVCDAVDKRYPWHGSPNHVVKYCKAHFAKTERAAQKAAQPAPAETTEAKPKSKRQPKTKPEAEPAVAMAAAPEVKPAAEEPAKGKRQAVLDKLAAA